MFKHMISLINFNKFTLWNWSYLWLLSLFFFKNSL